MVKVEMPRADWDATIMVLQYMRDTHGWLLDSLINDIEGQVDGQEY
jgi:hypothetical protein